MSEATIFHCYACTTPIFPFYNDWYRPYQNKGHVCQNCHYRRSANPWYLNEEAKLKGLVKNFNAYEFMRYEFFQQMKKDDNDPQLQIAKMTSLSVIHGILEDMDKDDPMALEQEQNYFTKVPVSNERHVEYENPTIPRLVKQPIHVKENESPNTLQRMHSTSMQKNKTPKSNKKKKLLSSLTKNFDFQEGFQPLNPSDAKPKKKSNNIQDKLYPLTESPRANLSKVAFNLHQMIIEKVQDIEEVEKKSIKTLEEVENELRSTTPLQPHEKTVFSPFFNNPMVKI